MEKYATSAEVMFFKDHHLTLKELGNLLTHSGLPHLQI